MKQYEASPIINGLIDYRAGYFGGWGDQFYDGVWNVDTAQGFGLDIWGRIVVIGRELEVQTGEYFGFDSEPMRSWKPFDQAPFYTGQKQTSTYKLADQAYRALILTKALTNISATDYQSLNRSLMSLFEGRGNAYVRKTGTMEIQYVFDFYLEPFEVAIIIADGILPRPAGVKVSVVYDNSIYNNLFIAIDKLDIYANYTLPSDMKIGI